MRIKIDHASAVNNASKIPILIVHISPAPAGHTGAGPGTGGQ